MGLLAVHSGDLLPVVEQVLVDSSAVPAQPVDLTAATSVTFRMRLFDSTTAAIDSAAVIVGERIDGRVRYLWQAGDTAVVGRFWAEWEVQWPSGPQVFGDASFVIAIEPDVLAMPAVTVADIDEVREVVGRGTPPTDRDIALRIERHGGVGAAARALLESRLADMLAKPLKRSDSEGYVEDWTGNVKALESRIGSLRSDPESPLTTGDAGGMTVTHLYRADRYSAPAARSVPTWRPGPSPVRRPPVEAVDGGNPAGSGSGELDGGNV